MPRANKRRLAHIRMVLADVPNRLPADAFNAESVPNRLPADAATNEESSPESDEDEINNEEGNRIEENIVPVPESVQIVLANYRTASNHSRTDHETAVPDQRVNVSTSAILNANDSHRTSHLAPSQVVTHILHSVRENRPSTTTKTYAVEQRRFLNWCENDSRFTGPSTYTINEEKLLVYLWEEVIGRTNSVTSTASRKVTVGISTVLNAITAVKDIWRKQVADNMNSYPDPRGDRVKALVKYVRECEHIRNVTQHADRARGTQSDGYTSIQEMALISDSFLAKDSSSVALRNRAMFLIQHYGVLRGQTARQFEFADLQHRKFNVNFPTECLALVMIIKQSKTNHVNRTENIGVLRAKDPRVCAVGAIGLYLFSRFHCTPENFPSLTNRKDWYQVKVFRLFFI